MAARLGRTFALTPLWVAIVSSLSAPTHFPAMRSEYPNILVANLGVIVTGLMMFWMLIGLYVLWRANSWHVAALV